MNAARASASAIPIMAGPRRSSPRSAVRRAEARVHRCFPGDAAALLITTVALVLLLSFKTPDVHCRPVTVAGSRSSSEGPHSSAAPRASARPRSTGAPTTSASPTPAAASGGGAAAGATTVDGPVVDTQFGPVQVRIDVAAGRVADVVALQLPTGRHSGQIVLRRAGPAPGGAPGAERQDRSA